MREGVWAHYVLYYDLGGSFVQPRNLSKIKDLNNLSHFTGRFLLQKFIEVQIKQLLF